MHNIPEDHPNPIIKSTFELCKCPCFQTKLNKIEECNISRFEKWFQIELAISLKNNNCEGFEWHREKTFKNCNGKKCIPDFEAKLDIADGKKYYTEITHINDIERLKTKILKDLGKFKNNENINVFGIFKNKHYRKTNDPNSLIDELNATKYKFEWFAIPNTSYLVIYNL